MEKYVYTVLNTQKNVNSKLIYVNFYFFDFKLKIYVILFRNHVSQVYKMQEEYPKLILTFVVLDQFVDVHAVADDLLGQEDLVDLAGLDLLQLVEVQAVEEDLLALDDLLA